MVMTIKLQLKKILLQLTHWDEFKNIGGVIRKLS